MDEGIGCLIAGDISISLLTDRLKLKNCLVVIVATECSIQVILFESIEFFFSFTYDYSESLYATAKHTLKLKSKKEYNLQKGKL